MKQGVEMKEYVGSANISPADYVAYVFGTKLFNPAVCIVLCCVFVIYPRIPSGETSCVFVHV